MCVCEEIVLGGDAVLGVGEEGKWFIRRLLEYEIGGGDVAHPEALLELESGEIALVELPPPLLGLAIAASTNKYR